jgi:DNA repair protein RecO (recombination protein O)
VPVSPGLVPAFVLHRREYRSTSLLLELFTRDGGRLPAIARGVRGARGPGAALLQPFRLLLVGLGGRGEVRTLTQVDTAAPPLSLIGTGLYCGFYLNELLLRLLPREDPHAALFGDYREALAALAGGAGQAATLRRFERQLLEHAGYAMVLDRDAGGLPLRRDGRYRYHPEQGPVRCGAGEGGFSVSGATLLDLAADAPLDAARAREARELMRRVLAVHLGDRPLKSRELFLAQQPPRNRP